MAKRNHLIDRVSSFAVVVAILAGCASTLEVAPSDPVQPAAAGQVRSFDGATRDAILVAVEFVLREHLPEGRLVRQTDTVTMERSTSDFAVIAGGEEAEKWVITAREANGGTIASVAMRVKGSAWMAFLGSTQYAYPQSANWARPEVGIDYGTFWRRVERYLNGETWPECTKPKLETGFRFFEPLCRHYTIAPANEIR